MERDVERAELLLDDDAAGDYQQPSWTPPVGLGPVPQGLVGRARALLERQDDLAQRLTTAARYSRRHDRALAQLANDGPRPPVYIDTPA
ncbi:MAG: hypothetical protein ACK4MD_00400 [Demequina sp.]